MNNLKKYKTAFLNRMESFKNKMELNSNSIPEAVKMAQDATPDSNNEWIEEACKIHQFMDKDIAEPFMELIVDMSVAHKLSFDIMIAAEEERRESKALVSFFLKAISYSNESNDSLKRLIKEEAHSLYLLKDNMLDIVQRFLISIGIGEVEVIPLEEQRTKEMEKLLSKVFGKDCSKELNASVEVLKTEGLEAAKDHIISKLDFDSLGKGSA